MQKVRRLFKLLFLSARIKARLLIARIRYPKFYPFMKSSCEEEKQRVEIAARYEMPPMAKGDALDRLGGILAVHRKPGENDATYRERIYARMEDAK